ncbi:MAG: fatty acid desaturase [Isosphaeraceae bacterium]
MRVLPMCVQPLLTWLVGKPLDGEARSKLTPWHHLASCLLALAIGPAATAAALARGGVATLAVLAGWILTVHGMRKLRTVIVHQCSHSNFTRNPRVDQPLGHLISFVLVTESFAEYRITHPGDHHSARHQTLADPTVAFLIHEMGLRAGEPSRRSWIKLLRTLVSPRYHAALASARLRSQWRTGSAARRAALLAYIAANFGLAVAWWPWALMWILPATVFFQMSTALRLSSRHFFPAKAPRSGADHVGRRFTHGIFLGDPAPAGISPWTARGLVAWTAWAARMVGVHLPARLLVLVGDGPCHDLHHDQPRHPDWANYPFVRAEAVIQPGKGHPPFTEVWGLVAAIQVCFETLERADPGDYDPATPVCSSALDRLLAIED